jgi:exodeoxyribonuclease VII large subunit
MARSDDPGELLLGFDMAPVLPGRKGSPAVRRTNPVPRSGSSIRSTLQDSTVGLPTEVPDAPSFGSRPPVSDSPDPEVLSVAQLTRKITGLLEDGIGFIRVEGEISNLRRQSSGHCYFTLKDEESQLSCVLFARSPGAGAEELREGAHVELHGRITVYRPRGQYQLVVSRVQGVGEGRLRARFEELKRRLEGEGLFDQSRKRALPRFPHRIGVVTSPSGAAIRDFLHVLHRRHPGLRVVIHPVRVQGKGAAAEIAAAVKMFSSPPAEIGPVDVVVVTRGGGSLEDLWEFNEEAVARAIAACSVPVVSAVGHEIDFSIADFTADYRAPTPSAAAEILAADGAELLDRCGALSARIGREALALLDRQTARTDLAFSSPLFRDPSRMIDEARQTADRIEESLAGSLALSRERLASRLSNARALMAASHPGHRVAAARQGMLSLLSRLHSMAERGLERDRGRIGRVSATLSALNPEATLARGFSITRTAGGKVITSASQVKKGDRILTQLADGEIDSRSEG